MAGNSSVMIIVLLLVCMMCCGAAGVAYYEGWTCSAGFGNNCSPAPAPGPTSSPTSSPTSTTTSPTAADGFFIGQAFSCKANDPTGASVTDCDSGTRGCVVYGYFGNKTMKAFNNMNAVNSYDPTFLSTGTSSHLQVIDCAGLIFDGNADIKTGALIGCNTTQTTSGYQSTGPVVAGNSGRFTCATNSCGGLYIYKGNNVLDYVSTMDVVNKYYPTSHAILQDCTGYTYGATVKS